MAPGTSAWEPVDYETVVEGSDLIVLPGPRPVSDRADGPPAPEWVWFGPSPAQRIGRERWNARVVRHLVAGIATGLFLLFFGLMLLAQLAVFVLVQVRDIDFVPQTPTAGDLGVLTFGLAVNLVLFMGIPAWWTWALYGRRLEAWANRLFVRTEAPGREVLVGTGWAFGMVVAAWMVSLAWYLLGGAGADGGTPAATYGMSLGTAVALVLAISAVASVSEEFFFRGWVQPRLGVVPANVLFGLAHLSYGTWLQVVVPMGLGFGFSWLVVKYRSLLPALVAHFLYDVVQLSLSFALAGILPPGMVPPMSPLVGLVLGLVA